MSSSCSTQEGAQLRRRSKTLMAKLSSVFRPSSASLRRSFPSSSFRFGSLLGILLTEGILFSRSQSNRYLSRLLRLWLRQTRTFAEYIAQLWTRDGRGGQTGGCIRRREGGRDRRIKDRERGIPISYAVSHKGRHSFLLFLFLPSPPIGLANSSCFLHATA